MELTPYEKDLLLRAARIILDNEHRRQIELENIQRHKTIQYLIDNTITVKE